MINCSMKISNDDILATLLSALDQKVSGLMFCFLNQVTCRLRQNLRSRMLSTLTSH